MLLNRQGMMCCLGQFCEQAGVPKDALLNVSIPSDLENIPSCEVVELVDNADDYTSYLANRAVDINDSRISISERERELSELFLSYGFTIEFTGEYKDEPTVYTTQ